MLRGLRPHAHHLMELHCANLRWLTVVTNEICCFQAVVGSGFGLLVITSFAIEDMIRHLLLDKVWSVDDGQCPVLILADRDQDKLFLEQISLFSPSFDTFVAMTD